jgi:cell division protein ZapE
LCFDEFHVSNIADAMILARLFTHLFDVGTTVVCTSNWPPHELYKNGLQRERFLTFIDLIKKKMQIYHLGGLIDHRFEKMRGMQTYFTPLGQEATRKLQGIFLQLTDEAPLEPIKLPVQGRTIKITHAARGVGFFNFGELCTEALGASDYLAIAKCLHTLVLDDVPKLTAEQANETLRFMTLIDALYEMKVKLFMASATPPQNLVPSGEHAFAFQRTVSRLMEMQSEEYRQLQHVG